MITMYRKYGESKTIDIEILTEISVLGPPKPNKMGLKCLSVCMLFLLCGLKASAKGTGPILLK